jgi:hypothetical protein
MDSPLRCRRPRPLAHRLSRSPRGSSDEQAAWGPSPMASPPSTPCTCRTGVEIWLRCCTWPRRRTTRSRASTWTSPAARPSAADDVVVDLPLHRRVGRQEHLEQIAAGHVPASAPRASTNRQPPDVEAQHQPDGVGGQGAKGNGAHRRGHHLGCGCRWPCRGGWGSGLRQLHWRRWRRAGSPALSAGRPRTRCPPAGLRSRSCPCLPRRPG